MVARRGLQFTRIRGQDQQTAAGGDHRDGNPSDRGCHGPTVFDLDLPTGSANTVEVWDRKARTTHQGRVAVFLQILRLALLQDAILEVADPPRASEFPFRGGSLHQPC